MRNAHLATLVAALAQLTGSAPTITTSSGEWTVVVAGRDRSYGSTSASLRDCLESLLRMVARARAN